MNNEQQDMIRPEEFAPLVVWYWWKPDNIRGQYIMERREADGSPMRESYTPYVHRFVGVIYPTATESSGHKISLEPVEFPIPTENGRIEEAFANFKEASREWMEHRFTERRGPPLVGPDGRKLT